jgi:hypothetical protein
MELARIKFSKPVSPYRKGEIAGFQPEIAKKYVEGKFAYYCDFDGNRVDTPEVNDVNFGGVPENQENENNDTEDEDQD